MNVIDTEKYVCLMCTNTSSQRHWVNSEIGLAYWGLTPRQQPGSYQGGEMMMMKSVIWWRKPEYPEETTDLRQVTDETFHTYGLCPVRGLDLGRSGVKQSDLRRDESGALAHRATAVSVNSEIVVHTSSLTDQACQSCSGFRAARAPLPLVA